MIAKCPHCNGNMDPAILSDQASQPVIQLFTCGACGEIAQKTQSGEIVALRKALEANAAGDESLRSVRSAVSRSYPTTVRSFLETYETVTRLASLELATAAGSLRTILSQIEGRLDTAIGGLAELGFVNDKAQQVLSVLREARDLVSTMTPRQRGMQHVETKE